ncbi:Putative hypothetical protein [Helicobacter mustelae 12198]|uniref:Uncharacterized protein n=1 Tax=Helicobacter mustelae (strain ATCC 43772 / CCUG 25715 / CIP 103759 / LMG 18044 / NCTC 12198 / R85-136P) TaxID=679897 RepID=D3UHF2_HELM1|nr:Putative hypothetical protein [Helicobacter mustelae 12198]
MQAFYGLLRGYSQEAKQSQEGAASCTKIQVGYHVDFAK